MKLYNTMTRNKEAFVPLVDGKVSMYSCGLTVYDEPHIGNWSVYIVWDLLSRVLKDAGYDVTHVENYTDVGHLVSDEDTGEDKMVKASKREKKSAWDVAQHYINRAEDGMKLLNIMRPTHMPRATDYIQQQIDFIQGLEDRGFTYTIADEGIYFDTSKLDDYGKLARLDIEGLQSGARVDDSGKRNVTDFALWKFSPKKEQRDMEWESPWGIGFPGWHIECSAMIRELLGDTIDIHTGGIDHIPVHHTNEIAQTESLNSKPFVHYWIHRNFIKIDGHKMSKSLGNIYTLETLQDKGYAPLDFRLLMLQSTYHNESNFSWLNIEAAKQRRKSLQAFADLRFQLQDDGISQRELDETQKSMREALQDDLNSPEALAILSQLETKGLSQLVARASEFSAFIDWLDSILGLDLASSEDITMSQRALLEKRESARRAQDFKTADDIRNELIQQRIDVRDSPHGYVWSRV
jgi:cysteinyl-tRNA synthetase